MAEPQTSVAEWLSVAPPLRSLPLDQEAIRIFEHAYQVGVISEGQGKPAISFSTLLIALLMGTDKTSKWFAERAKENGPRLEAVRLSKKFDDGARKVPAYDETPRLIQLSNDNQLLTVSARAVLATAEQWAHGVGGSDIGVRHLVASYVLNPPPNHRAQMHGWTFKESEWREEFFVWVAPLYTAEQWTDASQRATPSKVPTFELEQVKADLIAFPGDKLTMLVLGKAAEFHSGRPDLGLRLETVFFALIETAQQKNEVRHAIEPIWEAIKKVDAEYQNQKNSFLQAETNPEALFLESDISPGVLNALETARELTVATRRDKKKGLEVSVLHLAGALISRRVDSDEELAALGLNAQDLRKGLIVHAAKNNEPIEVWREALGEEEMLETGRPVDLNSDEPEACVRLDDEWKSDPLAIRADVEAFAALLASESLEPPLSIGLFGPWGSGKTTFIRRLQRAVQRRADSAKEKAQKNETTQYVSNVVHVDFNAWHFSEGALTSSFVEAIFREINAYINDDQVIGGKKWSELKRKALETANRKFRAAEELKAAAAQAVTEAEKRLSEARAAAATEAANLRAVVNGVWATTRSSLRDSPIVKKTGILDAIGETVNSAEELQKRLNALRLRPIPLLNDLGIVRSIIFAVLVLIVPLAVAWLVGWLINAASVPFSQIVSTMSAVLAVICFWLRAAAKAVGKFDQAIAEVDAKYEEKIASDTGVKQAQLGLETAQVSLTTAELSVQMAREALLKAQADEANASLPAQMLQLVSGRIEDQTYSRELTTLSLARADLQALSIILRDQRDPREKPDPTAMPAEQKGPRPVDRVILYIDDLDRCKPEDVVRVLQLVHMLLAFELFVVVVAVDARWIEESLINSYKWLADGDSPTALAPVASNGHPHQGLSKGRVTPQDYLEKIFQISFWLEPLTSARAASYLGSLVRKHQVNTPDTAAESGEKKIDIEEVEVDYMRALAAYVGPSPRRVKRLVNAYRLIKARLSDTQLKTFLQTEATKGKGRVRPGPYQLVIGLLVIGTGAPVTSVEILRELSDCDPKDKLRDVVNRFHAHDHADWTMAAKVIETLMPTQKTDDVSELRGWARKVGRFLLNSPSADGP